MWGFQGIFSEVGFRAELSGPWNLSVENPPPTEDSRSHPPKTLNP